ncbi:uncharacterized protein TRIADDRAFT_58036 [Trichoplax adhaerens]|uniref:Ubiquitin-like domain-containing protein n=1 Tax=Trichoplax adhaerens TaxID=10228 RepID=B3S2I4_TRIAD|nr:hypothetical protein TRIADDRAFT_58036 [Trichoplax adhaerens]EDV23426.1 hypothetical protein TRIADDRAFT_58036 [Trichoplax adhaerens]|eukprot:XP_002114336.1 hypothetical protein TRIADDRAFT_58036 [Trichoplax adhaerens]
MIDPTSSETSSCSAATPAADISSTSTDALPRYKKNKCNQKIRLVILSTSGARLPFHVSCRETVDDLKGRIASRIGLPIDKISLVYKERNLTKGLLLANGVGSGSSIKLLTTIETGFKYDIAAWLNFFNLIEKHSNYKINLPRNWHSPCSTTPVRSLDCLSDAQLTKKYRLNYSACQLAAKFMMD